MQVDRVPDFSAGFDTDFALSLGKPPQSAGKTEPVGAFDIYFAGHEAYLVQHGLPTFYTLDQHTFIRPATELFKTLGGALLTDIERLCRATIRVDSASLADRATRLGRGLYFGTPWLEGEGYLLFPDFPVVPITAYASFSEDFAAEPANRKFIDNFNQEAKHFFRDRDRDPEQASVPVSARIGLKASEEVRPLNEMAQEKNQSAPAKGRREN